VEFTEWDMPNDGKDIFAKSTLDFPSRTVVLLALDVDFGQGPHSSGGATFLGLKS
jgi:hypothetical protein